MTHYLTRADLTRAELNRDAPEHALRVLIDPDDGRAATDAHHRLIWTLFPGKRLTRDFLWRAAGNGRFYVLSVHEPLPPCFFRLRRNPSPRSSSPGKGIRLRPDAEMLVRRAHQPARE